MDKAISMMPGLPGPVEDTFCPIDLTYILTEFNLNI